MPEKTKSRKQTVERVHCNSCKSKTLHRILKTSFDEGSEPYDEQYHISWWTRYAMLECCGCKDVVLRRTYWFSEWDGAEITYYPPVISRHPPEWRYKLPTTMANLLAEVYRALDSDCRALSMMGARALLDMVIVDQVGDVGTFAEKLEQLESQGIVSSRNRKVLEPALDAGSAAAHRGFAPKTSDVHAVMDIVENVLQAVYILDSVAEDIKKATPPRTKTTKATLKSP